MVGEYLQYVEHISEDKEKHHHYSNEGPNETVYKGVQNTNRILDNIVPYLNIGYRHNQEFKEQVGDTKN